MVRVGVLRGGTGNQYEQSLATGAYVLQNLPKDTYEVSDIFLDREGVWHMNGTPLDYEKLMRRVDVIWNALHGFYGADGKVQQLLENLSIPYIGSGPLSSAITMNKKLLNDHLAKCNIKTPRGIYVEDWSDGDLEETVSSVVATVSRKFSPPWIVEPISKGEGFGGITAKTRDELTTVLSQMFELKMPVLIEEAVFGKNVSVSSIADFRGESVYTFLPTQTDNFKSKLHKNESELLQKLAKEIHKNMHLGHYSRVEAVISPKGNIYVKNIETVPALHKESDLHHAIAGVGSSFKEFAKHLIGKAVKK
jgi:D-alanine-D-alanine ligase